MSRYTLIVVITVIFLAYQNCGPSQFKAQSLIESSQSNETDVVLFKTTIDPLSSSEYQQRKVFQIFNSGKVTLSTFSMDSNQSSDQWSEIFQKDFFIFNPMIFALLKNSLSQYQSEDLASSSLLQDYCNYNFTIKDEVISYDSQQTPTNMTVAEENQCELTITSSSNIQNLILLIRSFVSISSSDESTDLTQDESLLTYLNVHEANCTSCPQTLYLLRANGILSRVSLDQLTDCDFKNKTCTNEITIGQFSSVAVFHIVNLIDSIYVDTSDTTPDQTLSDCTNLESYNFSIRYSSGDWVSIGHSENCIGKLIDGEATLFRLMMNTFTKF